MTGEPADRSGFLRRLLNRLVRSNDEIVADQRARESAASGANAVANAQVRDRVVLQGAINSITIGPRDGSPMRLEAELDDGTGSVALVWMGRRSIPGLDVGRRVIVRGTLTIYGGRRVIFNPRYELLAT
jgi:hypothetical protein